MCSSTFPGTGSRDTGLRSDMSFKFGTLGIGTTIAFFHSLGTIPEVILMLFPYHYPDQVLEDPATDTIYTTRLIHTDSFNFSLKGQVIDL